MKEPSQSQQHRIFPRTLAPIVIASSDGRSLELLESEFSLIPSWWNPEKAKAKTKNNRPVFATHNARIESIIEKPAFRDSFKKYHCLVPIQKFFESSVFGDTFAGHRISIQSQQVLLAAGCYSEWLNKTTGEIINSFTIITSNPNKQILSAGHDRMPIFLDVNSAGDWLYNLKKTPLQMKESLLESNFNKKLRFEIAIDRLLKAGWEKNAPLDKDIEELQRLAT